MHVTDFVWGRIGKHAALLNGSVVAVGAFDGVHLGHQALVSRLLEESEKRHLPSVVVLFEPQPNEFFATDKAPARLTRLREKVDIFQRLGVDRVVCLHFDSALRSLAPTAFVEKVLVSGLNLKFLVVGDDFRFGRGGEGDYRMLCTLGERFGFAVTDTKSFVVGSDRVSSTMIREALAQSNLDEASVMLGRPYATLGRVIYGKQLGRTIGFPTMNIYIGSRTFPLKGVFAVTVRVKGHTYLGLANIGVRPTVNTLKKPSLEVHVLDANIDSYGEFVRIQYIKKIRDEISFDGLPALKAQIQQDAVEARAIFAASGLTQTHN